jgi:hypothetical protein
MSHIVHSSGRSQTSIFPNSAHNASANSNVKRKEGTMGEEGEGI